MRPISPARQPPPARARSRRPRPRSGARDKTRHFCIDPAGRTEAQVRQRPAIDFSQPIPPEDSAGKNFSALSPSQRAPSLRSLSRSRGSTARSLRRGAGEFGRRSRADQIFRAGFDRRLDVGGFRHRADADDRAGHILRDQADRLDRRVGAEGDFDGGKPAREQSLRERHGLSGIIDGQNRNDGRFLPAAAADREQPWRDRISL